MTDPQISQLLIAILEVSGGVVRIPKDLLQNNSEKEAIVEDYGDEVVIRIVGDEQLAQELDLARRSTEEMLDQLRSLR